MSKPVVPSVAVGLAIAGAGLVLAYAPLQADPPITAAVQLTSAGSPFSVAPLGPSACVFGTPECVGSARLIGVSFAAPTPIALAAAAARPESCGLVCNGAEGTYDDPDGQDGGLLSGNGGNGWNGAEGTAGHPGTEKRWQRRQRGAVRRGRGQRGRRRQRLHLPTGTHQ